MSLPRSVGKIFVLGSGFLVLGWGIGGSVSRGGRSERKEGDVVMKKILAVVVVGCVACLGARGESPARVVGTVATGGTSFTVPASGGVAFRLEAVVFGAAAGSTQTVALVQGTITNQIAKKVVSATDRMLVVTNAPWLFQGESVRITTTAASAFPVVCTGVTRE
jgi:hypothetical protein